MSSNSNETTAQLIEKLASQIEAFANTLSEAKQETTPTKTASAVESYGSLDTRVVSGNDAFTAWLLS